MFQSKPQVLKKLKFHQKQSFQMFQPFICGSFNHQEEDDHSEIGSSPNSTPRKSRRNSFCKRQNKDTKNNPYSDRGLDKFSSLLAELEEKRQKIYSQTDSDEPMFVRFMYKNSTEFVPIVVKIKDKKEEDQKKKPIETKVHHQKKNTDSEVQNTKHHPMETLIEGKEVIKNISRLQADTDEKTEKMMKKKNRKGFSWNNIELHKWRRPSYYLPIFLVLILLLLVFFGRSVSILFTCIGWYVVPTIPGESSNNKLRRSLKKKDYVRKLSENRSSPLRDHHRQS